MNELIRCTCTVYFVRNHVPALTTESEIMWIFLDRIRVPSGTKCPWSNPQNIGHKIRRHRHTKPRDTSSETHDTRLQNSSMTMQALIWSLVWFVYDAFDVSHKDDATLERAGSRLVVTCNREVAVSQNQGHLLRNTWGTSSWPLAFHSTNS